MDTKFRPEQLAASPFDIVEGRAGGDQTFPF
jgi:hypothetical protein